MSSDTTPEVPKNLDQGPALKPPENPSDQQHASTFASSIRRATGSVAQAMVHLPMSAEIQSKFFPRPSEQDRSETIDDAVKGGYIDPSQAERLKKKLIPGEKPT